MRPAGNAPPYDKNLVGAFGIPEFSAACLAAEFYRKPSCAQRWRGFIVNVWTRLDGAGKRDIDDWFIDSG